MLWPVTGAMKGAGRGADTALITDGRFSGGTHGFCVGHVASEAVDGGPIGLVAEGDTTVIDAGARTIDLLVDAATLALRRADQKMPPPRYTTGVLAKYAKLVTGAERGAVTRSQRPRGGVAPCSHRGRCLALRRGVWGSPGRGKLASEGHFGAELGH